MFGLTVRRSYRVRITPPTPKPYMILKALDLLYKRLSDSETAKLLVAHTRDT